MWVEIGWILNAACSSSVRPKINFLAVAWEARFFLGLVFTDG